MKQVRRSSHSKARGRRRKTKLTPSTAGSVSPDLWEILGRFDRALSLVVVCHHRWRQKNPRKSGMRKKCCARASGSSKKFTKNWIGGRGRVERNLLSGPR
jgi:hypothetical protein